MAWRDPISTLRVADLARGLLRVRKPIVDFSLGEIYKKGGQSLNEDVHKSVAFVRGRRVGIARTGIGGQQVPGTRDGAPTLVDSLEFRFGLGAVITG